MPSPEVTGKNRYCDPQDGGVPEYSFSKSFVVLGALLIQALFNQNQIAYIFQSA